MSRLLLVGLVGVVLGFVAGAVSCLLVLDDNSADVSRLKQELKSERVKSAALEYAVDVLRIEREEINARLKHDPLPVSK
jgi:hypothetical protein